MTNLSPLVLARGRWLLALPLAGLLARPAQAQLATYGPPTDYSTGVGSRPGHVAVADVNGDGKPDLITANTDTYTVGVLLGNGNGTFQAMVAYSGGANNPIQKVAVADVNADGKPDILTANITNTVGVLLGNGNGTFRSVVTYSSGGFGNPFDLVAADVNGDGKLDVLTANFNTSSAGVLLGNGDGTFQAVATYPTQGANPIGIAVADINSDGKPDILTVNSNSNSPVFTPNVGILLGNGNGTFQSPTIVRTSGGGAPTVFADVNGDGTQDILTGGTVVLGTGSSTFRTPITSPNNSNLVDVNGDGRLDMISTSTITLGNGDGTFEYGTYYGTYQTPAPYNTGGYVYYAAVADVNGDGKPDIIAVHNNDDEVTVVLNTTTYAPDLVVNYTTPIAVGRYNSITINGPGVVGLAGPVTVNNAFTVNDGATLNDGCFVIDGPGRFAVAPGGTLQLCAAQGIGASGATGAVQVAGTRSFSTDANYTYLGNFTRTNTTSRPQNTGDGLPSRVRTLTSLSGATLTLTAPTSISQSLLMTGSGNLLLNGQSLTLLSSASGTALVANSGTGVVIGGVTVQRYIDPSQNPGLGYRHFAPPVTNSYVGDLATTGFAPVLHAGYNTAAQPTLVQPFPTVFGYDETRLASSTNDLTTFDKGFFSPAALADPLVSGRGYAVNIGGTALVDFVGSLHNGDLRVNLTRSSGTPVAQTGWALLGNPYAAPLDLRLVTTADRTNLNAAFFVYQSTGQYVGSYRSYVNGIGASPLIASSQGFFVQLASGQATGSLLFRNSQRVTSFASQVALLRPAADPRPQVQLELSGAGLADTWTTYAETGATPAFDAAFDAAKLPNPTGLNLSSAATNGESLAIDGRPAFTGATVLPLAVGVPAAGAYSLAAADLANLPTGLAAYLYDSQTGQTVQLTTGASYAFSVSATQAAALLTGRFSLLFRPATALATTNSLSAESVGVYPNPAHERFTVMLPGLAHATTVQAELLNGLGQVVRRQAAALPTAGTQFSVETTGLATGVYTLRLQAGPTTLAKRVVVW